MKKIYLTRFQCDYFGANYYDQCWFTVQANHLLLTKNGGYDPQHLEFLESAGNVKLILQRGKTSPPGWFLVEKKPTFHGVD